MPFWIHEFSHFFLSLLLGIYFYLRTKKWQSILWALVFGVLIDLDHLVDYFAFFGARFDLNTFLNVTTYMKPAGKIYVLFHGWEYLWPVVILLGKAAGLAYFGHLLIDSLNIGQVTAYSFIYRLVNNFAIGVFNGE